MDLQRPIAKLARAFIVVGLLHAACGGQSTSPPGAGGAEAASKVDEPSAGTLARGGGGNVSGNEQGVARGAGDRAGEAADPSTSGGGANDQAGQSAGPTAGSSPMAIGGAAGSGGEPSGESGAGFVNNGPECADVHNDAIWYCENWGQACLFDAEVCVCELVGLVVGLPVDVDFFDWRCYSRACPSSLPGPQRCIGTTGSDSPVTCAYGERSCTCDAELGEEGYWECPIVCPTSRPANHEPCVPSSHWTQSPQNTCTYDNSTCYCAFISVRDADGAEWTCTDTGSGGAPN